jgi:hypothetical protein
MSVMIPVRKKSKKSKSPKMSAISAPKVREAEAPEQGVLREAPDSGRVRMTEAPDAGEGRSSYLEHEFTHGRSQS